MLRFMDSKKLGVDAGVVAGVGGGSGALLDDVRLSPVHANKLNTATRAQRAVLIAIFE